MSGATEPNDLTEEEAQRLEQEHFLKVTRALRFYAQHLTERVQRARASFLRFSSRHQSLLPRFLPKLEQFSSAIVANQRMLDAIADHGHMFTSDSPSMHDDRIAGALAIPRPAQFDMDKVYTTVKQFVRDWAAEGQPERDACYGPIIDCLEKLFPPDIRGQAQVLVPGAGLGRLAFDIAARGFSCQGNEWSMYMLLASNWILNGRSGMHHTTIYPFAHMFCNNFGADDQLRPVAIPDVDTFGLPPTSNFSMAAGDFLEIYNERGTTETTLFACERVQTAVHFCSTTGRGV